MIHSRHGDEPVSPGRSKEDPVFGSLEDGRYQMAGRGRKRVAGAMRSRFRSSEPYGLVISEIDLPSVVYQIVQLSLIDRGIEDFDFYHVQSPCYGIYHRGIAQLVERRSPKP